MFKSKKQEGKNYIATAKGHDGMAIREKGEIFYFEGPKGSWMEEVNSKGEIISSDVETPENEKGKVQPENHGRDVQIPKKESNPVKK